MFFLFTLVFNFVFITLLYIRNMYNIFFHTSTILKLKNRIGKKALKTIFRAVVADRWGSSSALRGTFLSISFSQSSISSPNKQISGAIDTFTANNSHNHRICVGGYIRLEVTMTNVDIEEARNTSHDLITL